MSPSDPPTPPPSRWLALTMLPLFANFKLVWRRLCDALLPSSSLAGQNPRRFFHVLCLRRKYKARFDVNMNIKSSIKYFRPSWGHSQRRSQFKHDYCRGADRAPQIAANFTRDRRRVHRHTYWGKLGLDRIGAQMVTKAPCMCRPEGSLSMGSMPRFPPEKDSFR